jgi:hypothetical protein
MTLKKGDWVRTDTGLEGKIVLVNRVSAFVEIPAEAKDAPLVSYLLSRLTKIPPLAAPTSPGAFPMDPTITSHDLFEKHKLEHDALREKFRRIHGVLASSEIAAEEMASLLHELRNALTVHFSNEESDGFFGEITARAPRVANRADQLRLEHEQFLQKATELCQLAKASGSPMAWRELCSRCHEFIKQLMHHESEENKLLQEVYQRDIGALD